MKITDYIVRVYREGCIVPDLTVLTLLDSRQPDVIETATKEINVYLELRKIKSTDGADAYARKRVQSHDRKRIM